MEKNYKLRTTMSSTKQNNSESECVNKMQKIVDSYFLYFFPVNEKNRTNIRTYEEKQNNTDPS